MLSVHLMGSAVVAVLSCLVASRGRQGVRGGDLANFCTDVVNPGATCSVFTYLKNLTVDFPFLWAWMTAGSLQLYSDSLKDVTGKETGL